MFGALRTLLRFTLQHGKFLNWGSISSHLFFQVDLRGLKTKDSSSNLGRCGREKVKNHWSSAEVLNHMSYDNTP